MQWVQLSDWLYQNTASIFRSAAGAAVFKKRRDMIKMTADFSRFYTY